MKVFKIEIGRFLAPYILEIEVEGETEHFYKTAKGFREAKVGETRAYFKSYEDAVLKLIAEYENKIKYRREEIKQLELGLEKVNKLAPL